MNLNIAGLTGAAMQRPVSRKKQESQSSFGSFMVVLCKAVLLCGSIVGIVYTYCVQNNEIVKVQQEIGSINMQIKKAEREVESQRNICNTRNSLPYLNERLAHFGLKLTPAGYSQRNQLHLLSPEQVARAVYRAPRGGAAVSTALLRRNDAAGGAYRDYRY